MRIRLLLAAAASSLLVGCAAAPVSIYAKDGQPALMVRCGVNPAQCHARAQAACAGAYTPIESSQAVATIGADLHTLHALTFRCQ